MLCEAASSGKWKRGRDPRLCSITEVLILFACSTLRYYLSLFFLSILSRDVGCWKTEKNSIIELTRIFLAIILCSA